MADDHAGRHAVGSWASSPSSTGWWPAGASRRSSCSVPATTRLSSRPPTAGRWCAPTCSSRTATSGWTGPHRMTSAEKPSRRTPPTSRRWAAGPTAFVVGFGAPGDTEAAQAVDLADGMWHEAGLMGAGIVGGDIVRAPQWVISVAALGDLGGLDPVRRSGAKPGDTVAVVGDLGRSAAGYMLWHNGIEIRPVTPAASGSRAALRPGRGRGAGGRHRDDGCLRRPAGRPRAHRVRVGCAHRPVRRRPARRRRRGGRRGRRGRCRSAGSGCSGVGKITRSSRRSLPAAARLARHRHRHRRR